MNASCMHNNGDYLGVLDVGYKSNAEWDHTLLLCSHTSSETMGCIDFKIEQCCAGFYPSFGPYILEVYVYSELL